MKDQDHDITFSRRDDHWRVQPLWVKVLTVAAGLPACIILMIGAFNGNGFDTLQTAAFGVFFAVAIVQTAFVVRAYWKMEL
jgi:hypothetical protein